MDFEKFLKLAGVDVGMLLVCAKTVHEVEKWMMKRDERQRKNRGGT
jgi:hypothetical protein